jgi:hypothetical protein
MEKEEWKPFRNAIDKLDRKEFDEMFDIPKLYISACSNSCTVGSTPPYHYPLLFHHYKELNQCLSEIEKIEARVDSKKRRGLTIKEEEEKCGEELKN